jgi:hypothetical protein
MTLRKHARFTIEEDILWLLDRDRCLTVCAASLATMLPARASYSSTQKALLKLWNAGRLWRKRHVHDGVSRWFYRRTALKGYVRHG